MLNSLKTISFKGENNNTLRNTTLAAALAASLGALSANAGIVQDSPKQGLSSDLFTLQAEPPSIPPEFKTDQYIKTVLPDPGCEVMPVGNNFAETDGLFTPPKTTPLTAEPLDPSLDIKPDAIQNNYELQYPNQEREIPAFPIESGGAKVLADGDEVGGVDLKCNVNPVPDTSFYPTPSIIEPYDNSYRPDPRWIVPPSPGENMSSVDLPGTAPLLAGGLLGLGAAGGLFKRKKQPDSVNQ